MFVPQGAVRCLFFFLWGENQYSSEFNLEKRERKKEKFSFF